jgi:hypothetical protein
MGTWRTRKNLRLIRLQPPNNPPRLGDGAVRACQDGPVERRRHGRCRARCRKVCQQHRVAIGKARSGFCNQPIVLLAVTGFQCGHRARAHNRSRLSLEIGRLPPCRGTRLPSSRHSGRTSPAWRCAHRSPMPPRTLFIGFQDGDRQSACCSLDRIAKGRASEQDAIGADCSGVLRQVSNTPPHRCGQHPVALPIEAQRIIENVTAFRLRPEPSEHLVDRLHCNGHGMDQRNTGFHFRAFLAWT